MSVGQLAIFRADAGSWRTGTTGLFLAAAIVGVAIFIGGPVARVLNPIGAILWVVSGVLLARSLPAAPRPVPGWLLAAVNGVALGALVRPSSLPEAIIGFA